MAIHRICKSMLLTGLLACLPLLASAERAEGAGHKLSPVANAKWSSECGSCHLAYHPALLPERSWRKLMDGLDRHFGSSAAVDPPTQREITDFLVQYSADRSNPRLARSIPANAAPLRISETAWFKRQHHEVGANVWKRPKVGSASNCMACHRGADQGDFSERNVSIPR